MITLCDQCGSFHVVRKGIVSCPHANRKDSGEVLRTTCNTQPRDNNGGATIGRIDLQRPR